jgi:mannose-6-phosphate isomerase-like protein (cupin superfamily)
MSAKRPQPPLVGRRSGTPDATAPDGSDIRLLVDGRHHATRASLVEVSLAAGAVSRPVRHRSVEEIWYVLEGEGRVWRCPPDADSDSVDAVQVNPGDALAIPTGWRFQFSAGPGSPLRFLCYTSPPWPGEDEAVLSDFGGLGDATV